MLQSAVRLERRHFVLRTREKNGQEASKKNSYKDL